MSNGANISKKEADKVVREMKAFTRKLSSSSSLAKKFLEKTGIYTHSGALKASYK